MAENELTFTPALTLSDVEYQEAVRRVSGIDSTLDGPRKKLWQQWREKHSEVPAALDELTHN